MIAAILIYLGIGLAFGWHTTPHSWTWFFHYRGYHNFIAVTLTWPWLLAAIVIHRLTGRWPRWTPL